MNDVISKIKKLLRLSTSSNQNEAEIALARAYELARKHQIDVASLNLENDEDIERHLVKIGARVAHEMRGILGLVVHYFGVEVVLCPPNVAFIGRSTNVIIAEYVFQFLMKTCRAAIRDFKSAQRRKPSTAKTKNFINGWIYGVSCKLNFAEAQLAVTDSRSAIVKLAADPEVKAAKDRFYPNTCKPKQAKVRKNVAALMSGYIEGLKVDVRNPLSAPERLSLN